MDNLSYNFHTCEAALLLSVSFKFETTDTSMMLVMITTFIFKKIAAMGFRI